MSNPNIHHRLTLHREYARLRFRLDEELSLYHGIDFDDFSALYWLACAEGHSMSLATFSAELGARASVMLRRLRPLEKIGLIACDGGVSTRRIALSAAGLRLVKTAHDTVSGIYAERSQAKAAEDVSKLLRVPNKLLK